MELTAEQERDNALQELARLRAGLAAGLSEEQSRFIRGATLEEMQADARTLVTEFSVSTRRPPSMSGSDVRGIAAGSVEAGAAAYRAKHGLDENGQPLNGARAPFQENTYRSEH
ncbi:hypothetical protein [Streptomyces sp. NPDC059272]|uniref:hypothetical protein n=1 Tax=Streptomyces sp. NPDC059272 TaxID=3346800 RepID=UPI00368FDFD5